MEPDPSNPPDVIAANAVDPIEKSRKVPGDSEVDVEGRGAEEHSRAFAAYLSRDVKDRIRLSSPGFPYIESRWKHESVDDITDFWREVEKAEGWTGSVGPWRDLLLHSVS